VLNFAILSFVLLSLPSQGLPQEYLIIFYLSLHGIAFSSLTGIAGGFINFNNSTELSSTTAWTDKLPILFRRL
jgi:hypothetical protein